MDIEHDNRNAPSYLAHYGMHRPPFATKPEEDMYYAEPTRGQRLDILLHLTQYGNEMLVVTGPEGSGKSTLMRHFLEKAPGNWKICSLNAHAKLDPEQLLYRICHSFNLPVEPDALNDMIATVKRQLDQLLAGTSTVVVVMDNAHALPISSLALLTDLAKVKNQHSGSLLRIVLFAEPQIKIPLATIETENKPKYPIRKIDLPPFDEKHTGELIRHRTRTAGLVADNTFTDAAIVKIHKQSAGIPGAIVELAHRVLFEMTPLKRRTKLKSSAKTGGENTKTPLALVLAVVVVVVIALILLFQEEINRLYTQQTTPSQEDRAPARVTSPLVLPKLNESALEAEAVAPVDVAEAATVEPVNQYTAAEKNEDMAVMADQSAMAPANTPQESPSTGDAIIAGRTDQPDLARNIHREGWLLEQKPDYFTLQLVAGYQISTVNNYLNQHKLPATELAYYHSINKGKDWHSLVFGIYPDYGSAKLAIDTLPPEVRQANPWIRRLKNIQTEIQDATSQQPLEN